MSHQEAVLKENVIVTDRRPRFGIHTLQTTSWPELRDRWRWLDELGFDSLWLTDHLTRTARPGDPYFEAWTLLSALAVVTTRPRLGVLVSSNTFRHPSVLAKQAVTLDHISNANLCDQNEGLDTLGIRYGYRF